MPDCPYPKSELSPNMSRWINPPSRSCRRDMILLPLRLQVIVTGNDRAKESILAAGADQYLDYRKEHYYRGGLYH